MSLNAGNIKNLKKFVSIDLENPRFTAYKLSYRLWERIF